MLHTRRTCGLEKPVPSCRQQRTSADSVIVSWSQDDPICSMPQHKIETRENNCFDTPRKAKTKSFAGLWKKETPEIHPFMYLKKKIFLNSFLETKFAWLSHFSTSVVFLAKARQNLQQTKRWDKHRVKQKLNTAANCPGFCFVMADCFSRKHQIHPFTDRMYKPTWSHKKQCFRLWAIRNLFNQQTTSVQLFFPPLFCKWKTLNTLDYLEEPASFNLPTPAEKQNGSNESKLVKTETIFLGGGGIYSRMKDPPVFALKFAALFLTTFPPKSPAVFTNTVRHFMIFHRIEQTLCTSAILSIQHRLKTHQNRRMKPTWCEGANFSGVLAFQLQQDLCSHPHQLWQTDRVPANSTRFMQRGPQIFWKLDGKLIAFQGQQMHNLAFPPTWTTPVSSRDQSEQIFSFLCTKKSCRQGTRAAVPAGVSRTNVSTSSQTLSAPLLTQHVWTKGEENQPDLD